MGYILFILGNAAALVGMYHYFRHRFNRSETERINELTRIVRAMGEGDISQTAPEQNDRFGDLACAINDMATDIQEILILLFKQNTQAIGLLSRISETVRETDGEGQDRPKEITEIINQCDAVLRSHEDSRDLYHEFRFFGLDLNAGDVRHHEHQQHESTIRSKS
jgi:methyl-accepting chemotaxis protein